MALTPRDSFLTPNELWFEELKPGYPVIKIKNNHASATVALLGATVMEFTPDGEQPVIFMSSQAVYQDGKALRGGIPVCWPWFGAHPTDSSIPNHGFVRNRFWELTSTSKHEDYTELRLQIDTKDLSLEFWPNRTTAELIVKVGKQLSVELVTCNCSEADITVGGALHTYFTIGAIEQVAVSGLSGAAVSDTVSKTEDTQDGDIFFDKETDLIFHNTPNTAIIHDRANNRDIIVAKRGSESTVVWNPWSEKSLSLNDLGNEDYHRFVCVETTNACDDVYTLKPGGVHILGTTISVKADLA